LAKELPPQAHPPSGNDHDVIRLKYVENDIEQVHAVALFL
jgi:hypothetical protein